ncbi:midcut-by-XrtH protein [Marinobacterium georgiense]|uniref:midcut-by-XrtH protein n=1 Tax=Marinobacterium iners TaxID=48076 RepID=UPI001114DDEC
MLAGHRRAAHAIPIPSLLLLPLGIILAIVGLRQLSRNRAQQILGLLLTVGGTVTAVSSGVYVQETTASPATTELSAQQGGSVAVPTGPQDYRNTSGITLEIRSVNAPET